MASSKWVWTTTAAVVALLMVTGCGQTKQPSQGSAVQSPTTQESPKTPVVTAPPAESVQQDKQLKIKAFFGDAEMEKLLEREVTITYKQDQDKYMAALQALTSSKDPNQVALLKGFQYKSVSLKNGQLNVDVVMAPEARLGAGGEKLVLDALQGAVFQFDEIKALEILVEGKQVESLMGHMELSHPILRK